VVVPFWSCSLDAVGRLLNQQGFGRLSKLTINSVILPCEVKARELSSKLLLGCILAERGFDVVVGSRNVIHSRLAEFDRSVYLGKDVRHSSVEVLKILLALGHVFVAHDEEAQFYYGRENYLKARVHPTVFQAAEELMAWGPDNAEAWQSSKDYKGNPIHITGNGRMDMLRPELRTVYSSDANAHRKSFEKYILVSSNFSSLNHFIPNLSTVRQSEIKSFEMTGNWQVDLASHRTRLFRSFLELVPKLAAALPNFRIVVRPHPAENHVAWTSVAQGFKNVTVTNDGDILPWLLGAEALIHNGCTTGMEAYLMDRHAIAYQPFKSQLHDLHLPNQLSCSVGNAEELIDHLQVELAKAGGPCLMRTSERDAILARHVTTSDNFLASELIADVIERRACNPGRNTTAMNKVYGRTRAFLRTALKVLQSRKTDHKSSAGYTLHRFPAASLAEIEERLRLISAALRRFQSVRVTDLGGSVFRLNKTMPVA
jgi:surface carbohydrate biosynthesis protein